MSHKTQKSSSLSVEEWIFAAAVLFFCVGLVFVFLSNGTRNDAFKRYHSVVRKQTSIAQINTEDVAAVKTLSEALRLFKEKDVAQSLGTASISLSGIELSGEIQSFLHSFRNQISEASIDLEDRDLGFSDYTREVAIINEAREMRLLSLQVDMIEQILGMVILAEPQTIVSVRRNLESVEIPGEEAMNPNTGMYEPAESTYQYRILSTIEFEGYTSALRNLLNACYSNLEGCRIVAINVLRSEKSEADRTSDLIEVKKGSNFSSSKAQQSPSSPFAAYLQADESNADAFVGETKPLIGEVVSRFRITFEKGVMF